MTSFFQAFFSLVRHVPCTLSIVFLNQTPFDLVHAQPVLKPPAKLFGTFSSLLNYENVMFCLSRFSCLTDSSLWATCQHSSSLLLHAWTLSPFY